MENNPLRYNDPSGHYSDCSQVPGAARAECERSNRYLEIWDNFDAEMGIAFIEADGYQWTDEYKHYVRQAVWYVAYRFSGGSMDPAQAFRTVYGIDGMHEDFKFTMGSCEECQGRGGYTHGSRSVEFDGDMPFARAGGNRLPSEAYGMNVHAVVHELGHAFAARFKGGNPANPYWMIAHAKFATGESFLSALGYAPSPNPVSASGYWRPNQSTGSPNETFANMFLGWTYSQWEDSGYGSERAKYMTTNMQEVWLPVLRGR